jgi:hypothetical protein
MKGSIQNSTTRADKAVVTQQAVKVLASSLFRQMQDEGYKPRDIINVSSQLIDMLTAELQKEDLQKS